MVPMQNCKYGAQMLDKKSTGNKNCLNSWRQAEDEILNNSHAFHE